MNSQRGGQERATRNEISRLALVSFDACILERLRKLEECPVMRKHSRILTAAGKIELRRYLRKPADAGKSGIEE